VNHRFLDLKMRTPAELEASDPLVRKLVKENIQRGSVQVNINLHSERATRFALNKELAAAYLAAYDELASTRDAAPPPDLTAILRVPGVLGEQEAARSPEEQAALELRLENTLREAIEAFNAEREREGAGIDADVRERAERIGVEADGLVERVAELLPDFQARIHKRLTDILETTPVEPHRILQEAAILADRCDISEELQRLEAHSERLLDLLDGGGEVGKQLDFLAQEMNRETNTLLSKTNPLGAAGLPVTDAGLRLKAEIEKIREQAQNLE
jgi:uncharacterized protein (TIGR00255 family)